MKLAHKIALSFAAIIVVIIISGSLNYVRLNTLSNASDVIEHDVLKSVQAISKIKYLVSSVRRLESQMIIARGEERKSLITRSKKLQVESLHEIADMKKHVVDNHDDATKKYLALLDQLEKETSNYFSVNGGVINAVEAAGDGTVAEEIVNGLIFGEARKPYNAMLKAVDDIIESNSKFAEAQGKIVDSAQESATRIILGGAIVAAVVALFLGWKITTIVVRPIKQIVHVADQIAEGDLTTHIELRGKDEITELLISIVKMQEKLTSLVASVRESSHNLATASEEIAQGNMDLSSRTETQASSLQEAAASMEELATTVTRNAETAQEATLLADNVSLLAQEGGKAFDQVSGTMKKINDSSRNIGDIISVIDSIAFQTNILALNAAVEAARAGEQGKGFAVVAVEVRGLAGRSAEAAKQIKQLIDTSLGHVTDGVKLAEAAGFQMAEIVTSVTKVAGLVSEISGASKEQASGVAQVGEAVSGMDHTTQQNAALVEEMAAAANSLKSQSDKLVLNVSVFKLA